ncbi:zinc finger protein 544-like [Vanessa tameamea]|uniref:Zinc finger protein 544-like n=1 Tax=Vanessa tameamea TaxID=334116 RepID=A0A8B8HUQ1_VANTA|nr:zinc finger protein 544-like [Vanessa tameamea]
MEQQKTSTKFYEICRLCLDENGHCDIFDRNELQDNIYRCIGVKVSLVDSLPQKICAKCLEIIDRATELRIIAKKNDIHLKSLFCCVEGDTSKACPEDSVKTVESTHFERDKSSSPERNLVIEKFLSVRKDLFESSVTEESISKTEEQVDSSQNRVSIKDFRCEDGNREYKCNICSKKFNKWKKFYLHNRLHNKNYACPLNLCNKKFATKGDLEKHIRTHTGEKPYQCDKCGKGFAQRGTLKTHKETVCTE